MCWRKSFLLSKMNRLTEEDVNYQIKLCLEKLNNLETKVNKLIDIYNWDKPDSEKIR